ncbi:hypothetical protein [Dactylosporangium sp. NPDC048998]|uniref:hypothetical protein n=1 Tax=Dactylosporangium sp. NPDC048998 TaxID=3363976 RepID=UPI00371BE2A4
MRTYLDLVRTPGLMRLTLSQLLTRLPDAMLSIAVLMHVNAQLGSYAAATAAVASLGVSQAVATPSLSRAVTAWGAQRVLAVAGAVHAGGMLVLGSAPLNGAVAVTLAVVIGASTPPVVPVVRSLYPALVPAKNVSAMFTLDMTAQEVIWIVGPLLATTLAASGFSGAGLIAAGLVAGFGMTWFLLTLGPRSAEIPRAARGGRGVLRDAAMIATMLATFMLVASFTAMEVAAVAKFEGQGVLTGAAIALSSAPRSSAARSSDTGSSDGPV